MRPRAGLSERADERRLQGYGLAVARSSLDGRDVARCWAGFASLGAGLVHLAVVREHLDEWWLFGVFFAVLGIGQVVWAVTALARDRAPFPQLVAYGSLAVVALWAVTRTVGLPVGPDPWQTEAVGRADVLTSLLEIGVAGALLVAVRLPERAAPERHPAGQFVALILAGALAVFAITTPALADTPAGGRSSDQMEHE